jgi:hypothetical protein
MESKQEFAGLTGLGLRNFMLLSAILPVTVTLLAGKVMVEDRLWTGLAIDLVGLVCLWIANAGFLHLWNASLSEPERRKIDPRIPLAVVFGASFTQVFTAGQGLAAVLTLHQALH